MIDVSDAGSATPTTWSCVLEDGSVAPFSGSPGRWLTDAADVIATDGQGAAAHERSSLRFPRVADVIDFVLV